MIDREDMLELTRRMTPKRTSMKRIAGAYMDEDGYVDGTFNISFLKLSESDKEKNLAIAKKIPFAKTNENVKEYKFDPKKTGANSIYRLLCALRECGLKNDALMDILYDQVGALISMSGEYAFYLFHGIYDVPVKFSDGGSYYESEDVYEYLIGAVCPVSGDYEAGMPECGFLFPAFSDRSADLSAVDIYQKDAQHPHIELQKLLGVRD